MSKLRARRRTARLVSLVLMTVAVTAGLSPASVSAAARTFYVDCTNGSDTATGTSQGAAWQNVARANKAALNPGDSLVFKRGCKWTGTALEAPWKGNADAPITIGTYGTDPTRPRIANAGIKVTGDYEVIDGFWVTFDPVQTDPCGQPLGQYYALVITQGGSHALVKNNLLTQATAGIHISATAGGHNRILRNTLSDNNVMQTPFDGSGDLGAWGMLVRGSDNEIAYNTFSNNIAVCQKGTYLSSNSIEIYEGDRNSIHHNRSINDRVFSELGGSATNKAQDNSYAFNLHVSPTPGARFITTRGSADTTYGPVWRTTADRNTIYYTGAGSQGLVCSKGCSPEILTARYNIIDVVEKTIYYDQAMGQAMNLLWAQGGPVKIEDGALNNHTLAPGTYGNFIVADPGFVNPDKNNFRLRAWSPAIDTGGTTSFTTDLAKLTASNGAPDIGAFEFVG
jgi:hypothetical protein